MTDDYHLWKAKVTDREQGSAQGCWNTNSHDEEERARPQVLRSPRRAPQQSLPPRTTSTGRNHNRLAELAPATDASCMSSDERGGEIDLLQRKRLQPPHHGLKADSAKGALAMER